jgi:FtsP/CotA-like multicopper oxidase with cupredoxin domain
MTTSCTHESGTQANSEFTPLVGTNGREVVVNLEASATAWDIGGGFAPLEGWSDNGQTPGPTIEARQGDTLVVRSRP